MSTVSHYDQGELALFAMQLLPRNEYTTMAIHIADCTYCRQELAQLQGDLATYAHTVETHSPPSLVRDRLQNQITREKKFTPAERVEREEPLRQPPAPPPPRSAPPLQQRTVRTAPVERTVPFERRGPRDSFERMERSERVDRIDSAAAVPTFGYPVQGQKYATGLGSGRYLDEPDDLEEEPLALGRLISNTLPWVGWLAAAGLAIAAGNLYHQREVQRSRLTTQAAAIDRLRADSAGARQLLETITDPTARQVTLTKTDDGGSASSAPMARVIYSAQKGALIFLASNLDPVPSYKTYELWLIPADGRDPIPSGSFHPDPRGNASVILPPLPKGIEAKAFGITLEDEGGSQSPTMPIVMAGN